MDKEGDAMTRAEIMALSGERLRAAVCEQFGMHPARIEWRVGHSADDPIVWFDVESEADEWMEENKRDADWRGWEKFEVKIYRAVEMSLDAARLAEDEVERRGARLAYVYQLAVICGVDMIRSEWQQIDLWTVRRATPEQICRAALLAVLKKEGL